MSIFGQNGKPIALLFGEICSIFSKNVFHDKIEGWWKVSIFGQNGKPIALLFGEICSIFSKNYSTIRLKDDEKWAFLAEMVSLYPYFYAKIAWFLPKIIE